MDSYNAWVSDVVMGAEAFGAAIMVLGGLFVFIRFSVAELLFRDQRAASYRSLRQNLGRVINVGLEVLIVADIVRTIIVEPTFTSVGVLGIIVVIRILLSWSLEVEIEGTWPWRRWRLSSHTSPGDESADSSSCAV
jgi:uncharacterized membrane protein